MRNLLLLALLLYDIVASATRLNYDYDDIDKRHSVLDDRRNWRKKALLKPLEQDNKSWDERRRHDYENQKYMEDVDAKYGDRQRDMDLNANFRGPSRYDEMERMNSVKSSELGHVPQYLEKEPEKKIPLSMNCERQHERYEACFAGCAAVTCDNPRDRLRPCYPFCEAGCICVHPYVRDDRTHKCVLPDDCSKGLKGIPDLGDDI